MHRLLARQLRKLNLDADKPSNQDTWIQLLSAVDSAYREFEQDRYTLELSLEISSDEMQELYQRQKRSYEARIRAMFDSLDDLIWLKDANGKFLACNRAFEAFVGCSEAELVGQTGLDIIGHEQAECLREPKADAAIANEANGSNGRWAKFAESGRLAFFETTFVDVRDSADLFVGRLGISRDITRRTKAEAARAALEAKLREAQKMEAIGTLAGGIAHDFNNILATILGNAMIALADAKEQSVTKSIEEIQKAAKRARDLVAQILSFSRRQPTERTPMKLEVVVEDSARLLRATIPARVQLSCEFEKGLPTVLADETQIKQLMINLVANAAQAMDIKAGKVSVVVDTVMIDEKFVELHPANELLQRIGTSAPTMMVRLRVIDDGPGIPPNLQARIFEPFFTTKSVDEGTGLGLSVVQGIVQMHEGAITLDSELGVGTTFTVYFPAHQAAEEPAGAASRDLPDTTDARDAASASRTRISILYLDDDEALVYLVERLMAKHGFDIEGFTNQQLALAAVSGNSHHYALIVTDYNMPGMSGLDFTRAVKAIRPEIPVVIVSGFIDEVLQAEASSAGVIRLLFKTEVEQFCRVFSEVATAITQPT
ncbi:MAG: response regulator [Rhodocyclaceae bacterium]|nr:response regulator [Rhodocyclaceae bacterium]